MGIKLSTQISSKKKRYFSSAKPKKTYNFDNNDDQPYNEKDQESQCTTSGTDSFLTSGRTFHHVQNSAYWFPNDNEEMDRLIGVTKYVYISLADSNILTIVITATFCFKNTL